MLEEMGLDVSVCIKVSTHAVSCFHASSNCVITTGQREVTYLEGLESCSLDRRYESDSEVCVVINDDSGQVS
jgi:hypothetical protein